MPRDLIAEFLKDKFEKRTRIGEVDLSLSQELKENREAHDAAHEEIKEKVKAYIEQLRVEHEPAFDQFVKDHSAIWERIYDELEIPEKERGTRHHINHITGVVSRVETGLPDIFGDNSEDDEPKTPLQ